MANHRRDALPKGDIVVDENFFVSTVSEVALLGIPEVCPNVIGYVASLYVYYLFHDWILRLQPKEIDKTDATIWRMTKVEPILSSREPLVIQRASA